MAKHRLDRISEEVKRVVSEIIRNDLNDPRVSTMCSVVSAEVTPDLRYAKVLLFFENINYNVEKYTEKEKFNKCVAINAVKNLKSPTRKKCFI